MEMSKSILNRRSFLKTVGAGAASLMLPGCAASVQSSSTKKRPN
ncbi:MAG: twin-arginine translocation signal domain-containing protein, partial [Planctomycetes bacterium]|nr:twin-arginine translocation signal domain-containing protein [Planctomycetota bacterium]